MSDEQRFIAGRYQIGYSAWPCVRDMRLGMCAIFPEGTMASADYCAKALNEDPTKALEFQWRKWNGGQE